MSMVQLDPDHRQSLPLDMCICISLAASAVASIPLAAHDVTGASLALPIPKTESNNPAVKIICFMAECVVQTLRVLKVEMKN